MYAGGLNIRFQMAYCSCLLCICMIFTFNSKNTRVINDHCCWLCPPVVARHNNTFVVYCQSIINGSRDAKTVRCNPKCYYSYPPLHPTAALRMTNAICQRNEMPQRTEKQQLHTCNRDQNNKRLTWIKNDNCKANSKKQNWEQLWNHVVLEL